MQHTRRTSRRSSLQARHGIALPLVLIAMATATTLTLGWLASQDNASIVGQNIANAAEARALASSGIDLAASITQTETTWRTSGSDGVLLSNHSLGEGTIDLEVLDAATNAPPTETTTDLMVTATGRIGELSQVVTASISLLENDDGSLQGEVDDFALFALGSIELSHHALVQRWTEAPASMLGRRIPIATASGISQGIQLRGQAALVDGTLYQSRTASAAHFINRSSLEVPTVPLDWPLSLNGVETRLPSASKEAHQEKNRTENDEDLIINRNQAVQWPANAAMHVEGNLEVRSGASIIISGITTLNIDGDLLMDDSAIVLADDARLEVVVNGRCELDNASIGNVHSNWSDPDRVHLKSPEGTDTAQQWEMSGQTKITGIVEGDGIDLLLKDHATVRGRLAANTIAMKNRSRLFFDHGLGNGLGVPDAADLLEEHRRNGPRRSKRLAPLPRRFLKQLLNVCNGGRVAARNELDPTVDVSNWRHRTTPRPVAVEVRLLAHGVDPDEWERAIRILAEASQ